MSQFEYISIRQFCAFHQVDMALVEELIAFGLLAVDHRDDTPCIRQEDLDQAEVAVRLHNELGINPAGIETILHMRRRMQDMQERLEQLEARLRRM